MLPDVPNSPLTRPTPTMPDPTENLVLRPYLVGFGRDASTIVGHLRDGKRRQAWAHFRIFMLSRKSWLRRSYWGIWQCEWPLCRKAVRGLTRSHAAWRAAGAMSAARHP